MKISNGLLVIVFLLSSNHVFSQKSDKDIISYSYVKDEKGRLEKYKFATGEFGTGLGTGTDFLGSDDQRTYMCSAFSTANSFSSKNSANVFLYSFDKSTLKMIRFSIINSPKSIKNAQVENIFFFHKKIFVLLSINDRHKCTTAYYIQEFDGGTFDYKKEPLKLYDGGPGATYPELGYGGLYTTPPNFIRCHYSIPEDGEGDKMLFVFIPLKKPEAIQKINSILLDENLTVSDKNEYTLNDAAGKKTFFYSLLMNNNGRAFLGATYINSSDMDAKNAKKAMNDNDMNGKEHYKCLVLDLNNPGEFKESDIDSKSYELGSLKTFVVEDSLIYDISTKSTYSKDKRGIETSNDEGLCMGIYSLNTGDIVSQTMIDIEHKDFDDLKGNLKSADKTGSISVDRYFAYNKYTEKLYVIYEAVTEETKGNFQYTAGNNLKIKEFDRSLDQTASYTFSRVKGENGIIPVCTNEGTYFITDTREKNEDYGCEPDFKPTNNRPDYYVLKIKDQKLSAYGYNIKQDFDGAWTDLHNGFMDVSNNEKLFYSTALVKGQFSFLRIKFE